MQKIELLDVYSVPESEKFLYRLLQERMPHQSISHKRMPTYEEHLSYIANHPYQAWYLIYNTLVGIVGATYLTKIREVGLFIFNEFQGKGYGYAALAELRSRYPGRMLANINPENPGSCIFFERHGGKQIQVTYELGGENHGETQEP